MTLLKEYQSLKHLNTFGIDVRARYFAELTNNGMLGEVIDDPVYRKVPRMILGGGSNILFTRDFDGLILLTRIMGKRVIEENPADVLVEVGSGENWHAFVLYCIDHDWGGIENLSLIPGTTGAAPIQNIGAYGVEIKQTLAWVDGVDLDTGKTRRMHARECTLSYRDSVFKHHLQQKFFISSITLRLTRSNHTLDTKYGAIREVLDARKILSPSIRDVSDAVIHIRQSKLPDPAVIGNAGSFFKNPVVPQAQAEQLKKVFPKIPSYSADNQLVKIPAGWLIEQCGWKGKKIGRTGVHEQQALVLVNFGGASGEEIRDLSEQIRASVLQKFGITLMTEVNVH